MARPDRLITPIEIKAVIDGGEVIEDYPDDARGHSCLLLGWDGDHRPIHLVCSPKEDYLAIITAYIPASEDWGSEFRVRR